MYLDDILVHTLDEQTHQEVVKELLKHLDSAGLGGRLQTIERTETKCSSKRRRNQPYFPTTAKDAKHVYVKVQKKTPLGPSNKGPYSILERVGKSCIRVQVGNTPTGRPEPN